MGMDVYGRHPDTASGEYFRGQVSHWHLLADCICALAPKEASPCKFWHCNGGDGLNAAESRALADRLEQCIADGTAERYINALNPKFRNRQSLLCARCGWSLPFVGPCVGGVGIVLEEDPLVPKLGICQSCGSRSVLRILEGAVGLSLDDLRALAEFSRHSGGFSIC